MIEDFEKECINDNKIIDNKPLVKPKPVPSGSTDIRDIMMNDTDAFILVENQIDGDFVLNSFVYVSSLVYGSDVELPTLAPGCSCLDCSTSEYCECKEANEKKQFVYDHNGLYKDINVRNGIVECNARCKCSKDCINRIIQNGRKVEVILRKCKGKGWGVFAAEDIPIGTFITVYTGEIITSIEASKRANLYTKANNYFFDLDFHTSMKIDCKYTIDGHKMGNISHFFNHSCSPNLKVTACHIEDRDPTLHLLCFFSCEKIKEGDEMCFDYLGGRDLGNQGKQNCLCESKNCRKFVFS